ncbi:organic cation transporter protein-like [Sitophilus oryzae]|uniref:Organic cation transporter protein-like n=1 Tax=Sitophilus oryzae TaxID=7048 RepID=A0A6J2XKI1_SITOR|nr:organic cation transporter protein-like [Sitophilus oryzae]
MTVRKKSIDNSLDAILYNLSDFGKYQIYVFGLVCVAVVLHSMVHIVYVFTAMDLDYRCKVPSCDHPEDLTYKQPWLKNTIPFDDDSPEKCSVYQLKPNHTEPNQNCTGDVFDKKVIEKCDDFIYDGVEKTILQEFGLQCDENLWKLAMVGTVNSGGQFVGLIISGFISDRYGRRCLLVWGMVICALCGCLKAFMPTYKLFLLMEFLDAAFGSGSYICGFVLGVELVGPKKRVLTGTLTSCCYAIGEILVAIAAWIVKDWKLLLLVTYSPSLLLVAYLWLIPESIRWNLSKGRVDEAKKTLRKLASVNGKEITEKELETLDFVEIERQESNESLEKSGGIMEAVKSSVLMFRLVACCFCWITCAFLFYGLTLNSVALNGNHYLDFILTALVEVPAYFTCNFIVDKLGRKKSLCGSYFLTGAACLAFIFIPASSRWGSLSVYLIGKFGATASFTVLYVITSEMFPTHLRHSFMGTCSTFGRCGSMISPQTPLLAQIWDPLPLVCFGAMSLFAGLITLIFPETVNKKLPDTVKQAENIGKVQPKVKKDVERY